MIRLLATLALLLCAGTASADFSHAPQVPTLLAQLRTSYGFDAAQLADVRAALQNAQLLPQLIQTERNAPEKTLGWDAYRPIAVNPRNIDNGIVFMRENQRWLSKAEAIYGVPGNVITAIIGVETRYGRNTGHVRTLDALSTMAFAHPTRSKFFFSQLEQFFVLCRDDQLDALTITGSYAGALGMAQFMPSNYRRLAVDFDGNGSVNLWSAADAIGSIANYLVNYDPGRSWQRGMPIMVAAQAPTALPSTVVANPKRANSDLADLLDAGVVTANQELMPAKLKAALIQLDGAGTLQANWIAFSPFFSIMSYNPRIFYAMAVAQLASALAGTQRGIQ